MRPCECIAFSSRIIEFKAMSCPLRHLMAFFISRGIAVAKSAIIVAPGIHLFSQHADWLRIVVQ